MSTDYHLVCNDCNKRVETIASGSISYGDKLWKSDEALKRLESFLFEHKGHHLSFTDEYEDEDE